MSKKKYYIYSVIIILCVAAIILTNNMSRKRERQKTVSQNDDVVEISIATSWCGNDTKAQALERIINDFEKRYFCCCLISIISRNEFWVKHAFRFCAGDDTIIVSKCTMLCLTK